MRNERKVYLTAILLIFLTQESVWGRGRIGEILFDRNDTVLKWQIVNYGNLLLYDGNATVDFDSNLSSTLNINPGGASKDRWLDGIRNSASLSWRNTEKVGFIVQASEDWNRDTMGFPGKIVYNSDVSAGMTYSPLQGFHATALAGYVYDDRFSRTDDGFNVDGNVEYRMRPMDNLQVNFFGSGTTSTLSRSQDQYNMNMNLSWLKGTYRTVLGFNGVETVRGYFPALTSGEIQERKSGGRTVSFGLNRGDFNRAENSTAMEFSAIYGNNYVRDTANSDPTSIKFMNDADGESKSIRARIGRVFGGGSKGEMEMFWSKDDNGIERATRRRIHTDLATRGALSMGITAADTIHVMSGIKLTRIDTPKGVANDRDELKIEGAARWSRRISEGINTGLDFRVLESHYVNIDVSQSSQNKWIKTYILSPSVVWSPSRAVDVGHAVNVYAGYIDYDFDKGATPRSNISRRFSAETRVEAELTERTKLRVRGLVEENDYGLISRSGGRIPAEEGMRRNGDISVQFSPFSWLQVRPLYIHAVRHDRSVGSDFRGTIRRETDRTYGIDCLLFDNENGAVAFEVKKNLRNFKGLPSRVRYYATMTVRYEF